MTVEPDPLDECAACDHYREAHDDDEGACSVVGCECDEFTPDEND